MSPYTADFLPTSLQTEMQDTSLSDTLSNHSIQVNKYKEIQVSQENQVCR